MAAPVVSTNNEDIELKVTGVKTTVVENVELTWPPQRYPVERSYTGRFEGRQKCQERDTARSRSYASSGKSRLPLQAARVLGRQYVGSVSPTTLITGGDASSAHTTSRPTQSPPPSPTHPWATVPGLPANGATQNSAASPQDDSLNRKKLQTPFFSSPHHNPTS